MPVLYLYHGCLCSCVVSFGSKNEQKWMRILVADLSFQRRRHEAMLLQSLFLNHPQPLFWYSNSIFYIGIRGMCGDVFNVFFCWSYNVT